jgi:hypothetical protein
MSGLRQASVPDVEPTAQLEEYLRTAVVLGEAGPVHGGGAHPDKKRLLLEGGVQVIAKPWVEGNPDSERMMRREAAAWLVAKALGFTGLVGATVLRDLPEDHGDVEASVQVFWPDGNLFCAPISEFPDEDLWHAAVFDAVVAHGDHNGNNWLAVPAPGGPHAPRLKLIDNGHSFGYPNLQVPPNSTFYLHLKDQELPDHCVHALQRLVDGFPMEWLVDLVEQEQSDGVLARAEQLLQQEVLLLWAEYDPGTREGDRHMTLHVDVVQNKWSAGTQNRVARVELGQSGEITVFGDQHWDRLVRDALERIDADSPNGLLRGLAGHFTSDYVFATEPHVASECPFAGGDELPFHEARTRDRAAQPA